MRSRRRSSGSGATCRRLRDPDLYEAWSYRVIIRACSDARRRAPVARCHRSTSPRSRPRSATASQWSRNRDELERAFAALRISTNAPSSCSSTTRTCPLPRSQIARHLRGHGEVATPRRAQRDAGGDRRRFAAAGSDGASGMTSDPDLDRILRTWLAEGPERAPAQDTRGRPAACRPNQPAARPLRRSRRRDRPWQQLVGRRCPHGGRSGCGNGSGRWEVDRHDRALDRCGPRRHWRELRGGRADPEKWFSDDSTAFRALLPAGTNTGLYWRAVTFDSSASRAGIRSALATSRSPPASRCWPVPRRTPIPR